MFTETIITDVYTLSQLILIIMHLNENHCVKENISSDRIPEYKKAFSSKVLTKAQIPEFWPKPI